jgi:hypothetical protein
MLFSIDDSPQLSLDARFVATIRCVLTLIVPLTLDPLTRVRLSEVSYRILGLHGTASVLLSLTACLGSPFLILAEHRQPQSQRRVHKQLLKHGEQEVKASKKLCRTAFACETDAEQVLSTFAYGLRPRSHIITLSAPRHAAASGGVQAKTSYLPRWAPISRRLWPHGLRTIRCSLPSRLIALWPPTNLTIPSPAPGAARELQRPCACGMRLSLPQRPTLLGHVALSQKTRTDSVVVDCDDGVCWCMQH